MKQMKEEEKDKKYLENKQTFTVGLDLSKILPSKEGSTNIPPKKVTHYYLKSSFELCVLL